MGAISSTLVQKCFLPSSSALSNPCFLCIFIWLSGISRTQHGAWVSGRSHFSSSLRKINPQRCKDFLLFHPPASWLALFFFFYTYEVTMHWKRRFSTFPFRIISFDFCPISFSTICWNIFFRDAEIETLNMFGRLTADVKDGRFRRRSRVHCDRLRLSPLPHGFAFDGFSYLQSTVLWKY